MASLFFSSRFACWAAAAVSLADFLHATNPPVARAASRIRMVRLTMVCGDSADYFLAGLAVALAAPAGFGDAPGLGEAPGSGDAPGFGEPSGFGVASFGCVSGILP